MELPREGTEAIREEKPPTVSVVIPTRHRATMLRRAIRSVLAQTYGDFEVIVVDDGPSREAEAVVEDCADLRVRYRRHDRNRGAAAARNTGLRECRGVYIGFLDDDDEWLRQKLEKQVDKFQTADAHTGLVYAGSLKVSDLSGTVISVSRPAPLREGYVDFLRSTRFGTSVPLIRTACFDDVGMFDETLPATQDRDMWIRLARRFTFDFVPDILVRHHIHGDQITADLKRKVEARERILEKYRPDLEAHPDVLANFLWKLGMLCCADGRHKKGRRFIRRAVRIKPRLVGAYRDLVQSMLAPAAYERRLRDDVFLGADGVPFYY